MVAAALQAQRPHLRHSGHTFAIMDR